MDKSDLAKKIIDEIMSQKEFQTQKTKEIPWLLKILDAIFSFIGDVLEAIMNLWYKLFSKLNLNIGTGIGTSMSFWIKLVVGVLILMLASILVYFIVKLILKYARDRSKWKKDSMLGDELEEFLKEPEKPLALAYKYMEEKECRLSFRYFFLALLIEYNKFDLIAIDRYKTNKDYLKELYGREKNLGQESLSFFDNFYLIWYGKRPISYDDLLVWEQRYKYLVSLAGGEISG